MTIQRLSRLSDWRIKDDSQDLRGCEVWTRDGEFLGKVIDMVVDTEARRVTSLVLQNDSHIPTDQIDIEDGKGWVRPTTVFTSTSLPFTTTGHLGAREYDRPGGRHVPGEVLERMRQNSQRGSDTGDRP